MASNTVLGKQKSKECEDFLRERFTSRQRAVAFFNRFDYAFLDDLLSVAAEVKKEKYKEYQEELKVIAEQQEAMQKIKEIAAKHGLDIDGLTTGDTTKTHKKKQIDKQKYAMKFAGDDTIHYWSGFGRPPAPFKELLERGFKKEDAVNPKNGNCFELSAKASLKAVENKAAIKKKAVAKSKARAAKKKAA